MATTFSRGGTHSALVPQKWSANDYLATFEANPLAKYMGTDDGSIIQVNKDFTKEQGDKITFALRALLTGDGEGNDGTYSGNAQSMSFYDFSVLLAERGTSVALNGNMTEQSAYANLRPKGMVSLREWSGIAQAADIIAALSGLPNMKHIAGRVTGEAAVDSNSAALQTVTANRVTLVGRKSATALRWFGGGQVSATGVIERVATDAAIDSASGNLFGTSVISYVKRMAIKSVSSTGTAISPIRPVMADGKPYFIFFIDPLQAADLRRDALWQDSQQLANVRGMDNPLFSGAIGIWDGVVLVESDLLHKRLGAGGVTADEYLDSTADPVASGITVARGLFCGAQAGALAWGKMPVWKTGYSDPPHNTKYTVHTDMIYGMGKTFFANGPGSANLEFGCICVDTAVTPD